jgi:hypothetical protein
MAMSQRNPQPFPEKLETKLQTMCQMMIKENKRQATVWVTELQNKDQ